MNHPALQITGARENQGQRRPATRLAPRAVHGAAASDLASWPLAGLRYGARGGRANFCPCLGVDLSRYGHIQMSSGAVVPA